MSVDIKIVIHIYSGLLNKLKGEQNKNKNKNLTRNNQIKKSNNRKIILFPMSLPNEEFNNYCIE